MKETKKVFLPLTLDNSTKTVFSVKQLFGTLLFIIIALGFQVLVIRLYNDILLRVPGRGILTFMAEIIGLYFIIFLYRKIVLQENKMMRAYAQNQNLQKTDISFVWDIFSIRDTHIYYCNGMQGVIVRLTHGYLLDRAPDQEKIHRELINQAIGAITKQGYKFVYYNREVKDSNLGPLGITEHNLYKYKDTAIYDTANKIIKHTFNVCRTIANTEQEFYLILADQMDTIKKLDHIAEEFINNLSGSIYVKSEVLQEADIWDFISSLFGINYIDTSALLSKKFEEQNVQLVTVEEIFKNSDDSQPEDKPNYAQPELITQEEDIVL